MEKAEEVLRRTIQKNGLIVPTKSVLKPSEEKQMTLVVSRRQLGIAEAAVKIVEVCPTNAELAYMAKHLVQVTLPHSDPGDVAAWTRTNGDLTLVMTRSNMDLTTGLMIGYPYGTIPRLLLYWLTSEAVRTKSRVLKLGSSLAQFMREVGLNPDTGGGKRGDAARLKEQMSRLFAATISFQYSDRTQGHFEQRMNMPVTRKAQLWWSPKDPAQGNLFESWIELGEDFYESITGSPVPVDTRALKALNHSPLALDLYGWATHKAYAVSKRKEQQIIPFKTLQAQFGTHYADLREFRRKFLGALKQVKVVYPAFQTSIVRGALVVHPSRPSVPSAGR